MRGHTQEVAKSMDLSSACTVKTARKLKCCILELFQELNDDAGNHILEFFLIVLVYFLEIFKLVCGQYYTLNLFLSSCILGSSSELHLNFIVRPLARKHLLRLHHLEELAMVPDDIGALPFAIFVVNYTY
jgi:hypothetical protein